jgi:hypothetical protein
LREDGTPYYIGKGKRNRAFKKHSVGVPPKDRILFLKTNLSEDKAFKHEKYMVSIFGRKDLGTGILENKNAGGNGSSGKIYSEEERDRIRKNVLGRKWWNNGVENCRSIECPGEGWVLGRIITWDEDERLSNMKKSASKIVYELKHITGKVCYCKNLIELGKICGAKNGFYRVLLGQRKSYKGWISVKRTNRINSDTDPEEIANICKMYTEKTYKITHNDGRVMYSDNLIALGKSYGCKDGFSRVLSGKRNSYKGWISVELL